MKMPDFKSITYQRPSLELFRECVMRVRLKIMTAHSPEVIEGALVEFQKALGEFETAAALCRIRHDLNTKDAYYQAELAFFEEAEPMVSELSSGLYSALLNSEIAESLKTNLGNMIFLKAQNRKDTISREVIEDLAREAALENQYDQLVAELLVEFEGGKYPLGGIQPFLESSDRQQRKQAHLALATSFSSIKETCDDIFAQLVHLRTQIAQKLGYKDFVELGYRRMERYDYNESDVEAFRNFVVENIVPVTTEIRRLQRLRLEQDNLKYYDLPILFPEGNPVPKIAAADFPKAAAAMFRKMFQKEPSFYDVLDTHEFTDLLTRPNKTQGGYCMTLPDYGIPFIFMNASQTADDVSTLIHESGHAYAAIRSIDSSMFLECLSPTLEACEVHSTAMEFLTYPYMESFFGEEAGAYRGLHMTRTLLFLPYGCMVDEFQHRVYRSPEMTCEQRHEVWKELEAKYQPFLDYDQVGFYQQGCAWHKKGHIFTSPFYYIDYCLAQIVALELWDLAENDMKQALQTYDQLCQEGGNDTFLALIEKAGLSSPFSLDTLKRILYKACDYLSL